MKKGDQSLKIVKWSEKGQYFIGNVPGQIGVCFHSDAEQNTYPQLYPVAEKFIKISE